MEHVTRHDYWRSCYATMLAELSTEDILGFFQRVPMRLKGKDYTQAELLEHLFREKGEIPMVWNYLAVNILEAYLVEKGYDAMTFVRKLFIRSNRSTYMPGKIVMSWVYPVMDTLFNVYDPREMLFQMMAIYTENYLPGHIHPRIKKSIEGEWTYSYLIYYSSLIFEGYRSLNFDYIAGEQIKTFPRMFNLPEFEELSYLADCRCLSEVMGSSGFERVPDGMMFEGRKIAGSDRFHAFAKRHGLEIQKHSIPDVEILIALEDMHCPKRKRTVVYKGCAYLAPGYITVIKHRKIGRKEKRFLEPMLNDAIAEGDLLSPEVCARHVALVASLKKNTTFVYWAEDESITVDGVHFTKGIPAKILRHILSSYVIEGKKEFEYRDLKRMFEISQGQKNSNFEVRFYRLVDKIKAECPSVSIEKTGRGKFSLVVDGNLSMKEC